MKLKTKFTITFLTTTLLVLMVGLVGIYTTFSVSKKFDEVLDEMVPTLIALGQIKSASLQMISEARGYALIQSEEIESLKREKEFDEAKQVLEEWEAKLEMVAEDQLGLDFIEQIKSVETRIYHLGKELITLKKNGIKGERVLKKRLKLDEEEHFFITLIEEAILKEIRELEVGNKAEEQVTHLAFVVNIILTLVSLLIALILGILLANKILNPIQKLTAAAIELEKGGLDTRVELIAQDEIGELARSFNVMGEKLETAMDRIILSNSYLDNILHSMLDTLIVINRNFTIRTVNKATLKLLDYETSEMIEQPLTQFLIPNEPLSRLLVKIIDKGFRQNIEVDYQTKQGKKIPMLLSGSVMYNEDRTIQGMVFSAKNISERKAAEIKIKKFNDELERTNEELKRTQNQLVQSAKLASLGEISAGIAHELNQPLGVIRLRMDIAQEDIESCSYDLLEETLKPIPEQIERASTIIEHLKIFSRDGSTLKQEKKDINQIIEDSFILINEQAKVRGIKIIKDLADDLPLVNCNFIQIGQVMTNLLTNAKDAMASTVEKRMKVCSFQQEDQIVIEVQDTGDGIPEELQSKIFDPFFTTKEVGKGTGLGMSISYGIIKEHGGTIELTSEVGKGTTFRIELPIA